MAILFSQSCFSMDTPKKLYVDMFYITFPGAFCQSFGSACFDISQGECEKHAISYLRKCIDDLDNQIPSIVPSNKVGYWGGVLGGCTGNLYQASHRKNIAITERCGPGGRENLEKFLNESE